MSADSPNAQPSPSGQFNYPNDYRIGAGRVAELAAVCEARGIERPIGVHRTGVHSTSVHPTGVHPSGA